MIILSLVFGLFLVNIYGFGQRFFNFPSISTMNPEFARGRFLYLTPEARINSTFGGHYDLAAYIVLLTPILWGIYFSFKTSKAFLIINIILTYLVLMLTASRASIIGYLSTPLFLIYMRKFKYAIIVVILSTAIFMFNKDLSKRISQTFQVKRILVNEKTGQIYVPQKSSKTDLPAGGAIIDLNKNNNKNLNPEQTNELLQEATQSGTMMSATDQAKMLANSKNLTAQSTVVADTSFSTRLQIEWPRAIDAFKKNPLIGTGASSITEATDGDYHRVLGEFGILGFITFFSILFAIVKYIYTKSKFDKVENKFILMAPIFGLMGLLINALLIDVFEASKVAFILWLLMGVYVGYLSSIPTAKKTTKITTRSRYTSK
ncbi:MAG TPA: O-antigen ligase family protein [Candidatus Nitrosocosmicus sp.]|nr:O-antigen ligase family protein [Candidatus Nitrosocosmicus sp.]